MLILCPECETEISDKAIDCPHCGYPMQKPKISRKKRGNKHPKLPNGFGQISEIKTGNLRKPFRVMVTVGKTDTGKPISKLLQPEGFFKTYNEAYTALVEYNKNPYELDSCITVKELYDRWSEEHFKKVCDGTIASIRGTWAYCTSLYSMNIRDVRTYHIKGCIDSAKAIIKGKEKDVPLTRKKNIKSLFSQLFKYAMEYDLVDKNYAEVIDISEITHQMNQNNKGHMIFTDEEISKLWNNIDSGIRHVDVVLIQCYSGWRPQELGLIEIENVHLKEGYIISGMKTEAGKKRLVPIHPIIKPLIEKRYEEAIKINSNYLINPQGRSTATYFSYTAYLYAFQKIIKKLDLNPKHTPHDGRKHFVSLAKKYNVDEYAIKYIVGHHINDITERVYTNRETNWLIEEMKKIK